MTRKNYDDDLLVELIARGETPLADIAKRFGLGRSTVRRIAGGEARPDLQEKINARLRTLLAEKRTGRRQSRGRFGQPPADCPDAPQSGGGRPAPRPGGRRKEYDDDLVVDLIARGETSYAEIAGRVGLDRATVGMIARGESRPDLQERINTAMRSHLADKRRRPCQKAAEAGVAPPVPTGYRNKEYDDELLVELIARGNTSHSRIAKRVGLSRVMVGRIAAGRARPDLRPRIAAIAAGIREESHRLGARWLRGLLIRHIRDGLEGDGEFARRCRKDLIDKLFDPELLKRITEPPPPEPEPPGPDFDDLSIELRRKIMQEIGGPCEDADFVKIGADEEGEN